MPHHQLMSPSSLHRRFECPASGAMEIKHPEKEGGANVHTAWGSVGHDISDAVLKGEHALDEVAGKTYVQDGFDIDVTDEMIETVRAYLEHVRQFMVGSDAWGSETKVDLSEWVEPDDNGTPGSGTVDFWAVKDGTLYVRDLKCGKGVRVSADENPQLLAYALGLWFELEAFYDIDHIDVGIVQPRLDHIEAFVHTVDDIESFGRAMYDLDDMVRKDDAPFVASEEACRFCSARFVCKARAEQTTAVAGLDFDDLAGELNDPTVLSKDELSRLLHRVGGIRHWIADLEAHCLEMLMSGETLRDWKPVEGRATRKWIDEEAVEKKLRGTYKLRLDECKPRSLVSPAQAEKLVGKDRKAGLAPLIIKGKGKPTLALVTDKRPSIAVEFDDLTEGGDED